jgi:hypothetical protein
MKYINMPVFSMFIFVFLAFVLVDPIHAENDNCGVFAISPSGVDSLEADGVERPWQSVGYALARIPGAGGVTIQAEPGVYPPVSATQRFQRPVIIRSIEPHQACIFSASESGPVLLNGASNLQFDGFTIDNQNNPAVSNAVQILGGAADIAILNCVITHGDFGYANAGAIKINSDVQNVVIDGNILFNAMDELVELSDRIHDIVLSRNVLYQDSSSLQKPMLALYDNVWRVAVGGNVFIQRQSGEDRSPIQIGRGIEVTQDIRDAVIVNNTFIQDFPLKSFIPEEWTNLLFLGNLVYNQQAFVIPQPEIDAASLFRLDDTQTQEIQFTDEKPSLDDLKQISEYVKNRNLDLYDYFRSADISESLRVLLMDFSEKMYHLDRAQ